MYPPGQFAWIVIFAHLEIRRRILLHTSSDTTLSPPTGVFRWRIWIHVTKCQGLKPPYYNDINDWHRKNEASSVFFFSDCITWIPRSTDNQTRDNAPLMSSCPYMQLCKTVPEHVVQSLYGLLSVKEELACQVVSKLLGCFQHRQDYHSGAPIFFLSRIPYVQSSFLLSAISSLVCYPCTTTRS
jgi:hypothetical protein